MNGLDRIRAGLLKETLKVSFLHSLFHVRALRILVLFTSALFIYLLASAFFPLWVLLIGPVLWGVPHLLSSLRYSTYPFEKNSREKLLRFQFVMWAMVFAYRLANDIFFKELWLSEYPLLFESLCVLLSFGYQYYLFKKFDLKFITSSLLFAGLVMSTYFYPLQTALVALIGHNYLPLIAWYKSCQSSADLKTFWSSAALYFAASAAIYFGLFDFAYKIISPNGKIDFLNWDYSEVIMPYVNGDFDYQFWFHIVVLYAFSQSIHYFIWMKAIPENYQLQEFPPSFNWSFSQLRSDFGFSSVLFLFLLTVAGLVFWAFFEFQTARLIYFSIASYHGFMEISNLPFLKSNRR